MGGNVFRHPGLSTECRQQLANAVVLPLTPGNHGDGEQRRQRRRLPLPVYLLCFRRVRVQNTDNGVITAMAWLTFQLKSSSNVRLL